jgi:hypothetical protein
VFSDVPSTYGGGSLSPTDRDLKEDSVLPTKPSSVLTSKPPAKKGASEAKAEGARPAVKKGTRIDIDND